MKVEIIYRCQAIHSYTNDAVMALPKEFEYIIIEGEEYGVSQVLHVFPKKDDKQEYHVQIKVNK